MFNTLRKHGNLLLSLFTLMATSGILGVTNEAISYINVFSTRSVHAMAVEMGSLSTQFNFIIHHGKLQCDTSKKHSQFW